VNFAVACNATYAGLALPFGQSLEIATNDSGETAGIWVCANGSIQGAIESPNGTLNGPVVLGHIQSPIRSLSLLKLAGINAIAIAIDPAGDVVAAWNNAVDISHPSVDVSTATIGGGFSPPQQLADVATLGELAMNSSGDAIVTWGVGASPLSGTSMMSLMPPGGSFGPAIPAPDTEFALSDSGAAAFLDGESVVLMPSWNAPFGGPVNIPVALSSPCFTCYVGFNSNGDVYVVGPIAGNQSTITLDSQTLSSNLQTFGPPHVIAVFAPSSNVQPVYFATNPEGDAVIAIPLVTFVPPQGAVGSIEATQMSEGSSTFGPLEEVAAPGDSANNPTDFPVSLSLDNQGDAFLGWSHINPANDDCAVAPSCILSDVAELPSVSLTSDVRTESPEVGALASARLVAASKPSSHVIFSTGTTSEIAVAATGSSKVVALWANNACGVSVINAASAGESLRGVPIKSALTANHTSGPVGAQIKLKGKVGNRDHVSLYFDEIGGQQLGSATSSGRGKFHGVVGVPEATGGTHTFVANDAKAGCEPTTSFGVTPSLILSAKSGAPHTSVTAKMTGFGSNEEVFLKTDSPAGPRLVTTMTSNLGSATASFSVPSGRRGRLELFATASSGPLASARFRVLR